MYWFECDWNSILYHGVSGRTHILRSQTACMNFIYQLIFWYSNWYNNNCLLTYHKYELYVLCHGNKHGLMRYLVNMFDRVWHLTGGSQYIVLLPKLWLLCILLMLMPLAWEIMGNGKTIVSDRCVIYFVFCLSLEYWLLKCTFKWPTQSNIFV